MNLFAISDCTIILLEPYKLGLEEKYAQHGRLKCLVGSASLRMIKGFLPPSSRVTGLRFFAAILATCWPILGEPQKLIAAMSLCDVR